MFGRWAGTGCMSKTPRQTRFVYVRMAFDVPSSGSRPGWWHNVRRVRKPAGVVTDIMTAFLYNGRVEVETTDEGAEEFLKWAATIPGWANQLVVEKWENGIKISG